MTDPLPAAPPLTSPAGSEVKLRPATHGRRFLAGLVDFLVVAFICFVYFMVPMLLRGLVLPMWGVLLAITGYAAAPIAFLKKTFGMKLWGLELVTKDGHAVDPGNVLFRELLGRGYFPAAFLYTMLAGVISRLLGLATFAMPSGLGAVMFLASCVAVVAAVVGHFLAFSRPDGRTLADVMSGSWVVLGPARPLPDDAEERAEALAAHRRRVRNVVLFEVVLFVIAMGTPWALTMRIGETSRERGERIMRESLEKRFAADPGNPTLAGDLERSLLGAGLAKEARAISDRHEAAVRERERLREEALRKKLAEAPSDEATATALVTLLEGQDRLEDAKAVYRQWLGPSPSPSRRGGFGQWLATQGFDDEAVAELTTAVQQDPLLPLGHTMLGVALQRVGRAKEAQEELTLALVDDPDDEDAADAKADVDAQLGPLSKARQAQLEAQVSRWRADAGAR